MRVPPGRCCVLLSRYGANNNIYGHALQQHSLLPISILGWRPLLYDYPAFHAVYQQLQFGKMESSRFHSSPHSFHLTKPCVE